MPCSNADPDEVATGDVAATTAGCLKASALGSCVGVAVYDATSGVGGLAHIMLPGLPYREDDTTPTRFAPIGVASLLEAVTKLGAKRERLIACLAGGANVLEQSDDTIGAANSEAVATLLAHANIPIVAQSLGGTRRRSLILDLDAGRAWYTEGDGSPTLLWQAAVEAP